jgi:hypothetical protein
MFNCTSRTIAVQMANEVGLPYGVSIFNGNFYVGQPDALRAVGVVDIYYPENYGSPTG